MPFTSRLRQEGSSFKPPCDAPGCSFRIDADQKFNATTNLQYLLNELTGAWVAFSWRYDSGLRSSAIRDVNDLLRLTPAEQAAAGVSCGGVPATASVGFSSCTLASVSASRLVGSRRWDPRPAGQSGARRAAAPLRSRARHRQPVTRREGPRASAFQRDQSDGQAGALQFLVDVWRHPRRCATRVPE
jgi:hypothetical protein